MDDPRSAIIPDPPLAAYRPYFRPGAAFLTWATVKGEPILAPATTAHLLRNVLREVQAELQFTMLGWVILPDHVHLLLRMGAGGEAREVARRVRFRFQRTYPELLGIPGEMVVWASRQGLEVISELGAFAARLDYIHADPVAHGLVRQPEAWRQSSYGSWVERGLYKLGWGWRPPARLAGKRWELR